MCHCHKHSLVYLCLYQPIWRRCDSCLQLQVKGRYVGFKIHSFHACNLLLVTLCVQSLNILSCLVVKLDKDWYSLCLYALVLFIVCYYLLFIVYNALVILD